MIDIKIVSFPYKGEILKGTIKRKNRKTVTVETKQGGFRVPYSLLTSKLKPPIQKTKTKKDWSASQTSDYNKSLKAAIDSIPKQRIKVLHVAVKLLADALNEGNEDAIKEFSNDTIAEMNQIYNLPELRIYTGGKRRYTRRGGQYYGVYRTRGKDEKRHSVSVYSRTAKTQKFVAPRTFLRTLLHEWGHHYDKYRLRIENTYHTKGFYDRINTVYQKLKEPLDVN
ncbi:MAG: hypothetical protein V3V41_01320 [Candidatus Heimdallarchaeota archaeon]